jgi:phage head maturation protease
MNVIKSKYYSVKSSQVKAIVDVSTSGRTVTGFYNAYNFLDSDGDVLIQGSAKKSIKERGPKSNAVAKIKHALNHDLTQLPGKIITLEEKTVNGITGIYFETQMADTTLGNDTLKNYLEGIYDNHSIGFQFVQSEFIEKGAKGWDKYYQLLMNKEEADARGYMFVAKEILLYEGSTVAFGANSLTPYLGVKSDNKDALNLAFIDRLSKLEHTLKNGSQSDDMMKTFEIQVLQLKEMVAELTDNVTFEKSTPKEPEVKKTFDFNYIANNFKL